MAPRTRRTESQPEAPAQPPPAAAGPDSMDGHHPRGPEPMGGLGYYWYAYPALRFGAVILSVAVVAFLAWLLLLRPSGGSDSAAPGGGPVGTTQAELAALSNELGEPIYWAGTREGAQLEATVTTSEYVYVRYLSGDAPVGDSSPEYLTVATYPSVNAFANLQSYARKEHARTKRIPGGGIAVPVPGSPTSVYLARPNEDWQVEVYDPQPREALRLITSGEVEPVPGGVAIPTGAGEVSPPPGAGG